MGFIYRYHFLFSYYWELEVAVETNFHRYGCVYFFRGLGKGGWRKGLDGSKMLAFTQLFGTILTIGVATCTAVNQFFCHFVELVFSLIVKVTRWTQQIHNKKLLEKSHNINDFFSSLLTAGVNASTPPSFEVHNTTPPPTNNVTSVNNNIPAKMNNTNVQLIKLEQQLHDIKEQVSRRQYQT